MGMEQSGNQAEDSAPTLGVAPASIAMLTSAVDHGLLPRKDLDMASDPLLRSLKRDPVFDALVADARRHAGSSHN
jgi:hypothetical protein